MALLPPSPAPTVAAIYAAYEADSADGHRAHLGASVIGGACDRATWYGFRWASRARHTGRLLRLFETGHLAEARFVANLRRIGVTVLDLDPAKGMRVTGPFALSAAMSRDKRAPGRLRSSGAVDHVWRAAGCRFGTPPSVRHSVIV